MRERGGLQAYNDESTRDLICIDFSFGSRSYEEELAHLVDMQKSAETPEDKERIQTLIDRAKSNKWIYCKKSKDEIREDFYVNGVPIEYKRTNRKTGEVTSTIIKYKMLYRNASKAKVGLCNFINEKLYDEAYDWLTMGLGKLLPEKNAKIVEISAYAPLTTSTVEDRMYMDVNDVLILEDQDSFFHTLAEVVHVEDYDSVERVVDEEKTEKSRRRAISKGRLDIYGNPIYKPTYKKVPCKKKRCVVNREETDVKNTLWDGMALIESDVMPKWCNGMVLLRNHFFKACAFRTYIQKFLRNYAAEHNIDFDTWELEDMFGVKHRASSIKLITTNNAIKWLKFVDLMGGTKLAAYNYWCGKLRDDGCLWGCVKTDHPSKLSYQGDVQQLSYQMINTLPCSEDEIRELAKLSVGYVELLKRDDDAFERYLRQNATAVNHYEMMADLYAWNHDFANSRLWKVDKSKLISQYVFRLRTGKIVAPGDNLTVCGNPYALLLHTVGEDWRTDPTLRPESGAIQCYTTRFDDGEYLCGIRNPHNSSNNMGYFHNIKHPIMDEYFGFSNNIMAVNCIETDVQARMNGEDFDSDFNFVTNQPQMVAAAKRCYEQYPTVVNAIPESGITYTNSLRQYAEMDSKMQRAQKAIGGSSDSAQLAQSYYWNNIAHGIKNEETQELYENVIILAVLAQAAIDSIKRQYAVDPTDEIARIRALPCMNRVVNVGTEENPKYVKKDYPLFMKYTHNVEVTKNGKERPTEDIRKDRDKVDKRIDKDIICPMNWLQKVLGAIQSPQQKASVSVGEFFIKNHEKPNSRQITKIRKIVEEYDAYIRLNITKIDDYTTDDFLKREFDNVMTKLSAIKIRNDAVINRLIETSLQITSSVYDRRQYKSASKYTLRMLNILYRMDKDRFLSNFKKASESAN